MPKKLKKLDKLPSKSKDLKPNVQKRQTLTLGIFPDASAKSQAARKSIVNASKWASFVNLESATASTARTQRKRWRGEWQMTTSLMNLQTLLNELQGFLTDNN